MSKFKLSISALLLALGSQVIRAESYRVVVLDPGTYLALNNAGDILTRRSGVDYILHPDGSLTPLTSFPGYGTGRIATAINDYGQIAGMDGSLSPNHVFVWDPAMGMQIGPAVNASSTPLGNGGHTLFGSTDLSHLEVWTGGGSGELIPYTAEHVVDGGSRPNIYGQIAVTGYGLSISSIRSSIWSHGTSTISLNAGLAPTMNNSAIGITDQGHVAGLLYDSFTREMYFWDGVRHTYTMPGYGGPTAMNNNDQVVGQLYSTYSYAFIWDQVQGFREINSLIAPDGSTYAVSSARIINDAGWILGSGVVNGDTAHGKSLLLIPTDSRQMTMQISLTGRTVQKDTSGQLITRQPDGTEISRAPLPIASNGAASTIQKAPAGTYNVFAKTSTSLSKKIAGNLVESGSTLSMSLGSAALIMGDVTGDDRIDIRDFSALSSAYGTLPGNGQWNAKADLNADGAVNLLDFSILSTNYGLIGDLLKPNI